jgi:hypothetical protein
MYKNKVFHLGHLLVCLTFDTHSWGFALGLSFGSCGPAIWGHFLMLDVDIYCEGENKCL